MTLHLKPSEARFKGVVYFGPRNEQRFVFCHSRNLPLKGAEYKEQFLWYFPDGQEPRLWWCDCEGNFFEVSFTPIVRPS